MTLAASLPKFNADLFKSIQDAMYEAYMSSLDKGDNVDPAIAARIRADMEIAARKYALTFAKKLAPALADNIYKFVSEIGIILTPKGTLIAPQAPAGALPITGVASTTTKDFTIV